MAIPVVVVRMRIVVAVPAMLAMTATIIARFGFARGARTRGNETEPGRKHERAHPGDDATTADDAIPVRHLSLTCHDFLPGTTLWGSGFCTQ
jgi:hypothetical protein